MKKKLLVSFSGGETSAYMAQWLISHKKDEYEMVFIFANTGLENEETLQFVHKCDKAFELKVVWVEARVFNKNGIGNSFTVVDFMTASRDGQPFEAVIKKHGIPNQKFPHCTRETKLAPIKKYAKSIGWNDYYTAIGIREDEIDRMSKSRIENKIIYPLIDKEMRPMTKSKINFWWSLQKFRLELAGYQGNCLTCWKKSDNKLYTIAKENERAFGFMAKMELRYGRYIPESRLKIMAGRGELPVYPITFFRKNRSVEDIILESKRFSGHVADDSMMFDGCDIHAECGIDN